jgi:hypothetical protein
MRAAAPDRRLWTHYDRRPRGSLSHKRPIIARLDARNDLAGSYM